MIQVRSNTFETNSSSSHSIVLLNKETSDHEDYFKCFLTEKGVYKIYRDEDIEFGRYPFNILSTFADKVRYAIASYGESRFKEIEDLCIKYLVPVYFEPGDAEYCTGIELPINRWDNQVYYGDIDHQSSGLLNSALNKLGISLEQFLVDSRYIVIIDGDEYQIFDKMFDCGLIGNGTVERRID